MKQVRITLSVVSHGQIPMIAALLQDIAKNCQQTALEVILTLNVPEDLPVSAGAASLFVAGIAERITFGFRRNHNRAFQHARAPYFCVINPDIRVASDIFPVLMDALKDPLWGYRSYDCEWRRFD